MKPTTYNDQQNQLWIYLAICWWLGSLFAWLSTWLGVTDGVGELAMADSSLTFSGLLVVGASLALRLPVLTPQQKTSSMEDHFVWLLCLTANANWLGYLWLKSGSMTAMMPALAIGILAECWLWQQAVKVDCIRSLRRSLRSFRLNSLRYFSTGGTWNQANQVDQAAGDSVEATGKIGQETLLPPSTNEAPPSTEQSLKVIEANEIELSESDGSTLSRTMEDGIDPTGRRYLAGEIFIQWQPDQRSQQIVVGFVPAFVGLPEVEFELDSSDCSAQIVNCTPVGLRFQLRRSQGSEELQNTLSWYARAADGESSQSTQASRLESAESQPQTLA